MKCAEIEILLPSYLKGEENEMNSVIKEHLTSCDDCHSFTEMMNGLKNDLNNLTEIEPETGYVSKIHERIITATGTTKCDVVESVNLDTKKSPSSKRSVAEKHSARIIKLTFNEKVKDLFHVKLRTPAFMYSVAIHAAILFLSISAIYSHKIITESAKNNDIDWVRMQAYGNVSHQTLNNNSMRIQILMEEGPVYLSESKDCLQIQLKMPSHSNYKVCQVTKGVLIIPEGLAKKYFGKYAMVSILNYDNAIEVWSKASLGKYIKELQYTFGAKA
ncbi:MAG: hypothetical protein COA79_11105 [Planctomycetota bacterium]|nr:MAG: hypothetical protein COA79_11105 [Planctomycetota bacterium]